MAERDQPSGFQSESAYHRREWAVQRIGWIAIALVLAAAVAGLFGSGPLSDMTQHVGPHRVEYERFARYSSQTTLVVDTDADAAPGGDLPIRISHTFIDAHRVEAITPEPKQMTDRGDAVEFTFDAAASARIVFRLQPDRIGRHAGELSIGPDSRRLSQFVYP